VEAETPEEEAAEAVTTEVVVEPVEPEGIQLVVLVEVREEPADSKRTIIPLLDKEFHFHVYYDRGVEDIAFDYENAESGWNKLGTYYLKADTAKWSFLIFQGGRVVIAGCSKMGKTK